MLLYQTNDDGYWTGEVVEARESPEEPGTFLIPRGCIQKEPPALGNRQIPRWDWGKEDWTVEAVPEVDPQPERPQPVVMADFWKQMSDEEADAVEDEIATAPARLRRVVASAQIMASDDQDLLALRALVVTALGEARAEELLPTSSREAS